MKHATTDKRLPRNPGPPLGYQFLGLCDRLLPGFLFYPFVVFGTAIAALRMHKERQASREYLRALWGREPTPVEIIRHFYAQVRSLIRKVTLKDIHKSAGTPADDPLTQEFLALTRSGRQTLFGTFHVGQSDMIGAALATFDRKIHMVRLKVRNSPDLIPLKRAAGDGLEFVWVNSPEEITFALYRLLGDGASLAMQCDRVSYGSRHHHFYFLGAWRVFPVTIYHLSHLFQIPVGFALSVPAEDGSPGIVSSGVFYPDADSRSTTLQNGYAHFQRTLDLLETHLRKHPYIWFNFLPLNPVYEPAASTTKQTKEPARVQTVQNV